jgi:type I restriction enzyme S subunit
MGKLVPQDPNDEPASELLKRIQAEKSKLIAEGKVKKDKSLPEVSEEEINLNQKPNGWSFARWGQISNWITYGFTRPMPHENKGIPIITGKNVNNGKIIFETADYTTTEAFNELNAKDRPLVGDILITKDGSIGRTAIVETDKLFCINQSVAVIWLRCSDLNRSFLKLILDCPQSQSTFESKAEGVAIKHISVVDLGMMVLPIPPLGEQHRIVAKVDAMMAICDQLKSRIQQSSQQQQLIADALVAQGVA